MVKEYTNDITYLECWGIADKRVENGGMSSTPHFQGQSTLSDLFTVVYVMIDNYFKSPVEVGGFVLPNAPNQKGSYCLEQNDTYQTCSLLT